MKYFLILQFTFILADENCEEIICSNIFDYVCGIATWTLGGNGIVYKFQNSCHMRKTQCRLQSVVEIKQVPDVLCTIKNGTAPVSGRRLTDFSVVGAHQACNHTCPTYCVDTYEPACAQIWRHGMKKFDYRPMINHCHIDLFSCALGVNVTIQPLGKCYHNPSGLLFMSQVAAMKSLRLLDVEETPVHGMHHGQGSAIKRRSRRRSNGARDTWIDYLIGRSLK